MQNGELPENHQCSYGNLRNASNSTYPFNTHSSPSNRAGQTNQPSPFTAASPSMSVATPNLKASPQKKAMGPVFTGPNAPASRRKANNRLGMKYAAAPTKADNAALPPATKPDSTTANTAMPACATNALIRP